MTFLGTGARAALRAAVIDAHVDFEADLGSGLRVALISVPGWIGTVRDCQQLELRSGHGVLTQHRRVGGCRPRADFALVYDRAGDRLTVTLWETRRCTFEIDRPAMTVHPQSRACAEMLLIDEDR